MCRTEILEEWVIKHSRYWYRAQANGIKHMNFWMSSASPRNWFNTQRDFYNCTIWDLPRAIIRDAPSHWGSLLSRIVTMSASLSQSVLLAQYSPQWPGRHTWFVASGDQLDLMHSSYDRRSHASSYSRTTCVRWYLLHLIYRFSPACERLAINGWIWSSLRGPVSMSRLFWWQLHGCGIYPNSASLWQYAHSQDAQRPKHTGRTWEPFVGI